MGPEVRHGETTFTRELKLEAVRLIRDRGVSYAQVWQDLNVHPTQLRSWVKAFADDPQQAFPGQGQMKPEQLEIALLKREVLRLKAERDIQKKPRVQTTPRFLAAPINEIIGGVFSSKASPSASSMRLS
jgi:transposase